MRSPSVRSRLLIALTIVAIIVGVPSLARAQAV